MVLGDVLDLRPQVGERQRLENVVVGPRRSASTADSTDAYAVMMRTKLSGEVARTWSRTSSPLRSGRRRSVITRSKVVRPSSESAARPDSTAVTV